MSQAIYRKWRPRQFQDVIGQEHVTRTMQRALISGRVGHAYLFCGPRGTGKTTSARLLAKAVNCLHEDPAQRPCDRCSICLAINDGRFLDLIEIDAASNTGVDDIRDLRDKINFSPSEGRYKVYIIDEVHMLSTAAFNALLKTLEEPPAHAIFILATTEEHKVLATIKSRCQQYNFRLLSLPEIEGRLLWLVEKEGLQIEREAIRLIASEGAGSLRDAESLLDQLIISPDDLITLQRVQQVLGTASARVVGELVDAWLSADSALGLQIIHSALSTGVDSRQFCRQIVAYLRQLLLLKIGGEQIVFDLPVEQKGMMNKQAHRAAHKMLIDAIRRFSESALVGGNHWQPQLPLELAFIESLPESALPDLTYQLPPSVAPVAAVPAPILTPKEEKVIEEPIKKADSAESLSPLPPIIPPKIEVIQAAWGTLLAQLKQQDRNLPALLSSAQPLAMEGTNFILGFKYPVIKEKFDHTPNAHQLVIQTLSKIVYVQLQLRTVLIGEYVETEEVSRAEIEAFAKQIGGIVKHR